MLSLALACQLLPARTFHLTPGELADPSGQVRSHSTFDPALSNGWKLTGLPLKWDIAFGETAPRAQEILVPDTLANRNTSPCRRVDIPGRTCQVFELGINLELTLPEARSLLVDLREGATETTPRPETNNGQRWRYPDPAGAFELYVKNEERRDAPPFADSDYYVSSRTRACVLELARQVYRASNGKAVVRITDSFSERLDGDIHEQGSLHYSGQAVDVTVVAPGPKPDATAALLAHVGFLAWRSGCDFVWHEESGRLDIPNHLHIAVQEEGARWYFSNDRGRHFLVASEVAVEPGIDQGSMDVRITNPPEHLTGPLRGALDDLLLLIGLPPGTEAELVTRITLHEFSSARGGLLYRNDALGRGSSACLTVAIAGQEWELACSSDDDPGGVHLKLSTDPLGQTVYDGCFSFPVHGMFGESFDLRIVGSFRTHEE